MDGDAKRTAWFGVAIGVAVVALILALAVAPSFSPRWPIAVMAAAVALEATVAVMAWMRYRDSRDPHALLVCVAFTVLAAQGFGFGVLWPIAVKGRSEPVDLYEILWDAADATVTMSAQFPPPRVPLRIRLP